MPGKGKKEEKQAVGSQWEEVEKKRTLRGVRSVCKEGKSNGKEKLKEVRSGERRGEKSR